MPLSHRPKGYHSVTPYLIVDDAAAAIDFYSAPARSAAAVPRMLRLLDGATGSAMPK